MARVRGIYSTALVKLLVDHGFDIVQASRTQQERFRFEESSRSPDLDVDDRRDLQGISVLGKAETLNGFISLMRSQLDDVVVRRWAATVDGIYKGVVKEVDSANGKAFVDIGPALGVIRGTDLPNLGDPILVQVERLMLGAKMPPLTDEIKIPGKHVILLPGRQVKISRRILDWNARSRLQQLGERLATEKWGVLWRTSAANTADSELEEEIATLTTVRGQILEKARTTEAPAPLLDGSNFVDVEFPALSKRTLDEIRKTVRATIDGHHYYKASSQRVSVALDMAEKMLEKSSSQSGIDELFKQTVEPEYPSEGDWVEMEHVKLDGKVLRLGPALLDKYDSSTSTLELRRMFKREGVYDGLAVRKEPGDNALTGMRLGDWHFRTQYFSKDGQLKGSYVNLNTPIEFYPHGIRYVDLETDVCVWPDGRFEIVDHDRLEEALKNGIVTERLVETVKTKLGELIEEIGSGSLLE